MIISRTLPKKTREKIREVARSIEKNIRGGTLIVSLQRNVKKDVVGVLFTYKVRGRDTTYMEIKV